MARSARSLAVIVSCALFAGGLGCSTTESPDLSTRTGAATAPIAFVQSGFAAPQATQSSVSVTFTLAQGAGDLNVVAIGWNDLTSSIMGVSDSAGNSYRLAIAPTRASGAGSHAIYYASNIAAAVAGANVVSVTFSTAVPFPDLRVAEYSGVDPTNPLDVTAGATGSSNPSSSGAATTTFANDLLVGGNYVLTATTGPGTSFTSRALSTPDADILEDRVVTATGSYSASAPITGAGAWVMQMAAFRAAQLAPDTQPPTAPSNLSASAASSTQINLSWTAATDNVGVTSYLIERCQGAGCSSFAQVGTSATVTFASTGLAPQSNYSFRVRATDAAGNLGPYSNVASATTPAGPPPAPVFVQSASATPQTPQSSVAATYAAAQVAGDFNVVIVGWNDSTSQVASVSDGAGNSYVLAAGPTVLAGVASQSIYYAKNILGAAAGNVVTVRFNQAARFADIRVLEYRNVDPANPFDASVAATGSGSKSSSGSLTTATASDLLVASNTVETSTIAAGTGFTSRGITPDGDIVEDRVVTSTGSFSATVSLTGSGGWVMQLVAFRAGAPDTQPPSAPSGLTATTVSTSQINLTWTASTDNVGVTGYRIERCQGAGCSSFAQVGVSTGTTVADTGLAAQTSYSYRVRATDGAGNLGPYSAVATATTQGTLGALCSAPNQCASAFCADGVCCNSACTGNQCMACNVAGAVGTCSAKPAGTSCSDGNGCTQNDTCLAGGCVSGSPVVCSALDQCHLPGSCDPGTGACSNPGKPGGANACGAACVDFTTDDANCGGCGVACASGQACSGGVCRAGLSRWSTLGGDVQHSGFAANETGTPPLSLAWSQALTADGLWPAVTDGNAVYVNHDFSGINVGPKPMWALSPDDGHLLWSRNFGNVSGVSQLTASSGRLYVTQSNQLGDTFAFSLAAPSGAQLWAQPFASQFERYWAPLVVGSAMYFDGGYFGGLYGLSTAGGSQLFFNNQLEQDDQWSPMWLGGKLFTFVDGHLRDHDPQSGAILSTASVPFSPGLGVMTAPVSDGSKIYVISKPSLYAFTPDQATPAWTQTAAYSGMPAVANGVVYAVSGGALKANDAQTGSLLWTFAADGALDRPPVVAGRWVYAASDAHVYAVDTTTQQASWNGAPGGWLSIGGGALYVAQPNGTLSAYALTNGNTSERCTAGTPDGTPCSDGNACTLSDTCQKGACVGSSPVVCGALDQCHVAGACDPLSGLCTNPPAPGGGTACGSACVDISSDPANCGACGTVCSAGQVCSAGMCQTTGGWTTLGGDVHHSGFNPRETGTPPGAAAWSTALSPSPLWPVVSDGAAVYVAEKTRFASSTQLWALSPQDGHQVWSHQFGNVENIGQPAVSAGQVYIAQTSASIASSMSSFVASTGASTWSQPFNSQGDTFWSPLVVGSRIYFDGGNFGGLYGLSTADGSQLFFNNQLEQFDQWSPLWLNGAVYTFVDGHLRAHDAQTGAILATASVIFHSIGVTSPTSPVSDGTTIFAVAPPNLYAIRPDTMAVVWTASSSYSSTPAVAKGVVYAVSGGQLRANDAGIGTLLWSFPADGALVYPPVVAGHFVYAASDAHVYAVDTTTGQVAWSGGPGGWLSIADGNLYVAQSTGTLTAYALTH